MQFKQGTSQIPPSDQRIAWFQVTYGIKLPPEFLASLRVGNGATPLTNLFSQNGKERIIERMLCLVESPSTDVDGWFDITVVMSQLDARLIDNEELVGMNVIPFAALFGGDFLCLDYRLNPQSPVVAVWDHEQSEEFEPHLEIVANSFSQFETLLQS